MAHEQLLYDAKPPSDLQRVQNSCMWVNPHRCKRDKATYGFVRVVSCQYDNWWYKDLIDLEVFCELRWRDGYGKKELRDAIVVRLGKSQKEIGRGFDPKDVELL